MTSPTSPKPVPVLPGSVLEAAFRANVSILINRAHLAIIHHQYEAARTLLIEAIDLSNELPEPDILQARCFFWQGVIMDRIGREEFSPENFVAAIPCLDHSCESDRLLQYILNNWTAIQERTQITSQERLIQPEIGEQWRKALKDAEELKTTQTTSTHESIGNASAYRRHSLPSPLKSSPGSEDEDNLQVWSSVGADDRVFPLPPFEIKAGSNATPKAAP